MQNASPADCRIDDALTLGQKKAVDLLALLHSGVHTAKLRCSLFLQLLLRDTYATNTRAERLTGRRSRPFGAVLTM